MNQTKSVATSEVNSEVAQTEGHKPGLPAQVYGLAQEPVGSVRIAEPDSVGDRESDATTHSNWNRVHHQLDKLANRRLVTLREAQREVR